MSLAILQRSHRSPPDDGLLSRWGRAARSILGANASVPTLSVDQTADLWACTQCGACESLCPFDVPVADLLDSARAEAWTAGSAPPGVRGAVEQWMRDVRRGGSADRLMATATVTTARDRAASNLYLPGCRGESADVATAQIAVAARLGATLSSTSAVGCCGRTYWDAGDLTSFRAHVAGFWARVGEQEVVAANPRCVEALTTLSRRVGVEPRGAVRHWTEFLHRRLSMQLQARPLPGRARFFVPCGFRRVEGGASAARALLRLAFDQGVVEPGPDGMGDGCCGAGGLLPETAPGTANAMARSCADDLRLTADATLVTACPACRTSLRQSGLEVWDVAEVVSAWLGGSRLGDGTTAVAV